MLRKKHKHRANHVFILTSDAADADVKELRVKPWALQIVILIFCAVVGILAGYLIYEEQFWEAFKERNLALQEEITRLEEEKQEEIQEKRQAEAQVNELQEQIQILSDTVNQKVATESELMAQLEGQSLPTEFPLNGSAYMEESEEEGNPICIFTTTVGTTVVATARGTVTAVSDDVEYGHSVWIDHGNGYITIYRNEGEVTVKEGDSVVKGTTLFLIQEEDSNLGYQMQKDGTYISPMDMLSISG